MEDDSWRWLGANEPTRSAIGPAAGARARAKEGTKGAGEEGGRS
jgi:hypothetical protein